MQKHVILEVVKLVLPLIFNNFQNHSPPLTNLKANYVYVRTPSISIAKIRKSPHIPDSNGVSETRKQEFCLIRPISSLLLLYFSIVFVGHVYALAHISSRLCYIHGGINTDAVSRCYQIVSIMLSK